MAAKPHRLIGKPVAPILVGSKPFFVVKCQDADCDFEVSAPSMQEAWMKAGAKLQQDQDEAALGGRILQLEAMVTALAGGWVPSRENPNLWLPPELVVCECGRQAASMIEVAVAKAPGPTGLIPSAAGNVASTASADCSYCGRSWRVTWTDRMTAPAKFEPPKVTVDPPKIH